MDFAKHNITNVGQLMNFMQDKMKYGFTDGDKVYTEGPEFGQQMAQHYQLKTGEDLVKSGYGVCWDFCELEREFCEQKQIPHECYFFLPFLNHNEGGATHTFLLFEQNEKWHWFESAWQAYRGIWEYATKEEALNDIMNKLCQNNERPYEKIDLYKTAKAKAGSNFFEYIEHCLRGEKVDTKLLTNNQCRQKESALTR